MAPLVVELWLRPQAHERAAALAQGPTQRGGATAVARLERPCPWRERCWPTRGSPPWLLRQSSSSIRQRCTRIYVLRHWIHTVRGERNPHRGRERSQVKREDGEPSEELARPWPWEATIRAAAEFPCPAVSVSFSARPWGAGRSTTLVSYWCRFARVGRHLAPPALRGGAFATSPPELRRARAPPWAPPRGRWLQEGASTAE
jgi:hypothetical protein